MPVFSASVAEMSLEITCSFLTSPTEIPENITECQILEYDCVNKTVKQDYLSQCLRYDYECLLKEGIIPNATLIDVCALALFAGRDHFIRLD